MRTALLLAAPVCIAQAAEPAGHAPTYDDALQLSPLAERLAACGEDEAGIRTRLELIAAEFAQHPATYHLGTLPVPDVSLIPISISAGDGRHLGGAQWAANNQIVRLRMTLFTSPLPEATDAESRLQREMLLNDTLAHELAHCCFYFRYPKLAKITEGEPLMICEGLAISTAHEFIQRHYFGGASMPKGFYEKIMLSPRYTRIYQAFCERYRADNSIPWNMIDAAELQVAPSGYELRNRRQIDGHSR